MTSPTLSPFVRQVPKSPAKKAVIHFHQPLIMPPKELSPKLYLSSIACNSSSLPPVSLCVLQYLSTMTLEGISLISPYRIMDTATSINSARSNLFTTYLNILYNLLRYSINCNQVPKF